MLKLNLDFLPTLPPPPPHHHPTPPQSPLFILQTNSSNEFGNTYIRNRSSPVQNILTLHKKGVGDPVFKL